MSQDAVQIPKEHLRDYLLGSLCWCGLARPQDPDGAVSRRVLAAYEQVVGHGHFHIPFFLVFDLVLLVEQGYDAPFASDTGLTDWNDEQRGLMLRYEREILARVLQAPGMSELSEMLRMSPDRDSQTVRLLVLLMATLGEHLPRRAVLNPALLRRLSLTAPNEASRSEEAFCTWAGNAGFFSQVLNDFLNAASQQIRWAQLIREEDIWELTHWRSLSTEHLRIGCRQIIEVERRLGEFPLPKGMPVHDGDGDAETAFVDETYYPMGGLSEMTNRGAIENLVTSQLVYIEPGPEINVFDVRYLEGELLYYMRDEGSLRRKRRTIHFILDLGSMFEWKSRSWDYQFAVLTQGLCLRLLLDLFALFEHDSVHATFSYISRDVDPEWLDGEIQLLRLLLDDSVRHGWVTLQRIENVDLDKLRDAKRKSYALVLAAQNAADWQRRLDAQEEHRQPIRGVVVGVGGDEAAANDLLLERNGMSWRELAALRSRILAALV